MEDIMAVKKSFRGRYRGKTIDVKPSKNVNPRLDLLAKKSLNSD